MHHNIPKKQSATTHTNMIEICSYVFVQDAYFQEIPVHIYHKYADQHPNICQWNPRNSSFQLHLKLDLDIITIKKAQGQV